jgi:hypothetical protein
MSLAGVKAAIQLVSAPSFWEKTVHGLDGSAPELHTTPGMPGARPSAGAASESS